MDELCHQAHKVFRTKFADKVHIVTSASSAWNPETNVVQVLYRFVCTEFICRCFSTHVILLLHCYGTAVSYNGKANGDLGCKKCVLTVLKSLYKFVKNH